MNECEATQRGGQKCKAEAKWWVGDPDDDPQRVCEHHAALARRYGWPVRPGDWRVSIRIIPQGRTAP